MDARAAHHVGPDQLDQRLQRCGTGADPVGQGRHVEIDPLAREALALPIERQMLAKLAVEHHRQQAGAGAASRDRMEGRRRLGDPLAGPAGELLPNRLDHLPLARHHLQRLGDVLAQLGELAAAGRTGTGCWKHDALARQMRWQVRPHRIAALEALHHGRFRRGYLGGDLVLGRGRLELLELQLHLVELPTALGRLAPALALQLRDHQLQMGDHRFGARRARRGRSQFLALPQYQRVGFGEIGRERCRHACD